MDEQETLDLAEWWASELENKRAAAQELHHSPPYLTADPQLDKHLTAMHLARVYLAQAKVALAEYCHGRLEKDI